MTSPRHSGCRSTVTSMPNVKTASLTGAALAIMVAQVILPAALDLVGSIALLLIGGAVARRMAKP